MKKSPFKIFLWGRAGWRALVSPDGETAQHYPPEGVMRKCALRGFLPSLCSVVVAALSPLSCAVAV